MATQEPAPHLAPRPTLRLILFTRYPVPGQAKTRLIPALGADGAAEVHRRLTERTVVTLRQAQGTLEIAYTGGTEAEFHAWLGGGLGDGIIFTPQVEGDLTDRLLAMLHPAPVIFFGADTPGLTLSHVEEAIAALSTHAVVIGPAEDGGYYLIGMREPLPYLLNDMPWSTDAVLPETLARLSAAGIVPHMLPMLADCDRPEDVANWPELTA